MAFNLFITSPRGREYRSLNSPYESREMARSTIRMMLIDSPTSNEETQVFIARVLDAPPGETVTHEATGISFRTEEAS